MFFFAKFKFVLLHLSYIFFYPSGIIFVSDTRTGSIFFFQMDMQLCQHQLLKSPLFSLWIEPAPNLSYVKLSFVLTSNSGLLILFQWPTCLSLYIHHIGLLQRFYCVCYIWSKFSLVSFLIIFLIILEHSTMWNLRFFHPVLKKKIKNWNCNN